MSGEDNRASGIVAGAGELRRLREGAELGDLDPLGQSVHPESFLTVLGPGGSWEPDNRMEKQPSLLLVLALLPLSPRLLAPLAPVALPLVLALLLLALSPSSPSPAGVLGHPQGRETREDNRACFPPVAWEPQGTALLTLRC